jgi:HAE1 family hydrophobic/amphiphilic exporter-1
VLVFTEAAQDISFEEMIRHQEAAAAIVAQQPYVDAFMSSVGSVARSAEREPIRAACSCAEDRMSASGRRSTGHHGDLRRQLAAIPGLRAYPQVSRPAIRIGGQLSRRRSTSSPFSAATCNQLYAAARDMEHAYPRAWMPWSTSTPTCRSPARKLRVDIQRDRAATLGSRRSRSRTRSTAPSARGRSPPSTRRPTSTTSSWRWRRNSSATLGPFLDLPARPQGRQTRPRSTPSPLRRDRRAAHGQPPRPGAGRHDFIQPQARGSLGDATAAIDALAQKNLPATVSYAFQGLGAGVRLVAQGHGPAAVMAVLVIYIVLGHPLRGFHPPADDFVRPAGGELRRAVHALGLP